MSDRFGVAFQIGGQCSKETYDRLLKLINEQGPEDEPMIDRYLTVDISEVSDGDLPEIEEFCTENNLEWHKQIEGKYDFNSVWVWWKPGMEKPNGGTRIRKGSRRFCWSDCRTSLTNSSHAWLQRSRP